MNKIPEVFAIFEQKLAHVLSFTVVPLKSKDLKNALEEILTYFSGIVERASKAESRIAELETEKECEMRVFKDGNAWCFVLPDFQDLQVSPSVWMKKGVLDKIYKELRSVRDE